MTSDGGPGDKLPPKLHLLQGRGVRPPVDAKDKGARAYERIVAAIKALGVSLSFDSFGGRARIVGLGTPFDGELSDMAVRRLQDRLYSADVKGVPTTGRLTEICYIQAEKAAFHPVKDWLASLEWDGFDRLTEWTCTYLGAEPSELNSSMGCIWMIAAVRRVRQPGCKFDHVLILQGETGLGKSSACGILAHRREWFSDSFPPFDDERRQIEALEGRWIIEYPDLAGMRKADGERIKAFLSRQSDRARAAYGRLVVERPRSCVFIGTTEEQDHLSDMSNRRFWPLACSRIDLERLAGDVEQLWAEAAYYEAKGEPIALPGHLWGSAAELQHSHVKAPAFADAIAAIVGSEDGAFPCLKLREWLGISLAQWPQNMQVAGKSLQFLGFRKMQIGAPCHGAERRQWLYVRSSNGKHYSEVPTIYNKIFL